MKSSALYLLESSLLDQVYGPPERERIARWLDVIGPSVAPRAINARVPGMDSVEVILSSWGMPRMTPEFLRRFPKLEMVFYGAGSVRDVATPASWERGVRIVSASAANAVPTAEFAFASIVFGLKQAWRQSRVMVKSRRYRRDVESIVGTFQSTVGILGLGKIGRHVVRLLRSLAIEVIAYDPMVGPEAAAKLGVELCSLEEVFARCDAVSCHVPLLPETVGMIRAMHFRAMKPNATFINTSRGAIVAEDELIAVLRERLDLFAVLDVTHPEPPHPESPLLKMPNVFLTPHIGGCVGQECRRLGATIADEVERYASGRTLWHEVTRDQALTLA